jgi:hypothetical protein
LIPLPLSETLFMVSGTILSNPKLLLDYSSYFYMTPKSQRYCCGNPSPRISKNSDDWFYKLWHYNRTIG